MPEDKKPKPEPIIVKRQVKHVFTPAELAALNEQVLNAMAENSTAEQDATAMKATLKAHVEETKARMNSLAATARAKFEMREKDCSVTFRVPQKLKDITCIETGELVATEPLTDSDLQMELVQAEKAFDPQSTIQLFQAGVDKGIVIVGQFKNRWYSAARITIGGKKLEQRLDSEQKAFKERVDAINFAVKGAFAWIEEAFDSKVAAGFKASFDKTVEAQKEKAE